MKTSRNLVIYTLVTALAPLLAGSSGCMEPDSELDELVLRDDDNNTTTSRKQPPVGFINNGLHDPQVGGFDPSYALDTDEGLDGSRLDSPARLATAEYAIECALPLGESVTKLVEGEWVDFEGALGLAPQWQDGPCDESCQQWVSACLLARTNVSEHEVTLWLKASHPALGTQSNAAHPHYEASFFGNLFAGPDQRYMCPQPLVGPVLAQLEGRTCSNVVGGCELTSYSLCQLTARCDFVGLLAPTAIDCRPGNVPGGPGMNTISTYVATPLL